MHLRLFPKGIVVALILLFVLPLASTVSLAQPEPPASPIKSSARSNSPQTQYKVFLPLIALQVPPPKKGVPLTHVLDFPDGGCSSVTTMNAFWEFAWGPIPPNCAGIENVPMIWGTGDMNTTVTGNSQWIMGFNEPDNAGQANLTPSQAAVLWRQIEQKYPTRKLLSPASNGDIANWLSDFRTAYFNTYGTWPRLDGIAIHCYRWFASQCIPWVQQNEVWANAWGVPEIWVTEFSFATTSPSSPSQSLQEQHTFATWLEGQAQVTRFGWFASRIQGTEWWFLPGFHTPLVDYATGAPTAYGNVYLPFR